MKIAIIPTTGGEDPFRGMEIAVQLGVEGVHIPAYGGKLNLTEKTHEERLKIRERIEKYGLEVSALIAWGGDVDLGEEKNLRQNIEWGKKINETAVDIANGLWMAHVGIMPEDESHPKWSRFVASLKELAQHGEEVGATLALETGPEPPVILRKMVETINSPAIRVNFDPANLLLWPPTVYKRKGIPFNYEEAMENFDPVKGLKVLIPYVVHAHAKDSTLSSDGKALEVPLGTGMTNWQALHQIFKENNYQGYYAIEREVGENAMEDVKKAVEFLRKLQ
ncbi:TPA: sugar phosphate isomerase/epimerase [Candidatus Poribacteria bacterium]|nr:sugar phosphate isomerase/epimerase [Candidatus Poribacteria bacterium]